MVDTGVHEWLPHRGWSMATSAYYLLFGGWLVHTADDPVGYVLVSVYVVAVSCSIFATFSYRVQADDAGLHVRDGRRRTRSVPWSQVTGVGQRSRWWGSTMWFSTRDHGRLQTGLRAENHPSLATHVRVMTGRATLKDYATFGADDDLAATAAT